PSGFARTPRSLSRRTSLGTCPRSRRGCRCEEPRARGAASNSTSCGLAKALPHIASAAQQSTRAIAPERAVAREIGDFTLTTPEIATTMTEAHAMRACRDAASRQLFNLAWITAVRGRTADGVGRLDADRQVDVGTIGVERIVAGQLQFGAGLPPAVPRGDDAVGQLRIELSPGPHPAVRRRDRQPIALPDTVGGSGRWT